MNSALTWKPVALLRFWPGIMIAAVIALAASFISSSYGGPQLLFALFIGLAFHFLSNDPVCRPGIDMCSKNVLRTGVALLGARITLPQVASLGGATIALVVGAVVSTIACGYLLARVLNRPLQEGILSGGAVGICGASAAMAIAAVLPQTRENERFTLLTVVGVTALSTLAMVVYPLLVRMAGLDPTASGIFIGGTVHDVAQVVGAGYLISNHTGDIATIVKLTRVACLVPVVLALCVVFQRRAAATGIDLPSLVPLFLVGFVLIMLANTYGLIPAPLVALLNTLSHACLVTAIAALGVKTSLQAIAQLGWRPIAMMMGETIWIAVTVFMGILMLH